MMLPPYDFGQVLRGHKLPAFGLKSSGNFTFPSLCVDAQIKVFTVKLDLPFLVHQSQKSLLASAEHPELATAPAHPCFRSQAPTGRQAPTGLPLASPTSEKIKCQKEEWSITGAQQHWGCSELGWVQ